MDRSSQRTVELELVGQTLEACDRFLDRSGAVQEGLREEPGKCSNHLDAGARAAPVLEGVLDRHSACAPAACRQVPAAPQPPGAGERELVTERFELCDRIGRELDALLDRRALGEGSDELELDAGVQLGRSLVERDGKIDRLELSGLLATEMPDGNGVPLEGIVVD